MRWLFFVLVLINLVAAYWFYNAAAFREEQADSLKNRLPTHLEGENHASLLLLEERPALAEEASEQPPVLDNVQPGPPTDVLSLDDGGESEPRCLLIGPLVDIDTQKLRRRLAPYSFGEEFVSRTTTTREDHWLIIPPLASQAEAGKMLKGLRSKGIDSFLIAEGEYKNGITLGVFSDEENMQHYWRKLVNQGHPVVIVPRASTREERWLQLRRYSVQSIPRELIEALDQQGKSTERQAVDGACVGSDFAQ